jgi:prepilin-type N-terminal cleavage/methylation domain-containing protein
MAETAMTRRRAFTLIELLVVITIMLLLATMVLSAIAQAQLGARRLDVAVEMRSLANACNAYATNFDGQAPGVLADPPTTGGLLLTGCQSLRLSLLGGTRNGASYTPGYAGPYDPNKARQYEPYYKARPGELIKHAEIASKDPNTPYHFTGYDGTVEVFVDAGLKPPRPILYFRKRHGGYNGLTVEMYQWDGKENAVYCVGPEVRTTSWTWNYYNQHYNHTNTLEDFIGTTAMAGEFVLLSAGVDRQYFTPDDVLSSPR